MIVHIMLCRGQLSSIIRKENGDLQHVKTSHKTSLRRTQTCAWSQVPIEYPCDEEDGVDSARKNESRLYACDCRSAR
jgi:hypothetical protein